MMNMTTGLSLYLLACGIVLAQERPPDANLTCVKSLELPTVGLFAVHSVTSGTVNAVVHIGKGGNVRALDLEGGTTELRSEVSVAIELSEFSERCEGRSVALVFSFVFFGPPSESIQPPRTRFLPPNRFELKFRSLKANIEAPAPPPPPAR